MGFKGESLIDKRCWIVKTHFPESMSSEGFYAERVLLICRNPIDSIISWFNMQLSGSHDKSIDKAFLKKVPEGWEEATFNEFCAWIEFYDFYLKTKIPTHIVRYEDIVQDKKNTFMGIMKFLLNKNSVEGTVAEKIIDLIIEDGKAH